MRERERLIELSTFPDKRLVFSIELALIGLLRSNTNTVVLSSFPAASIMTADMGFDVEVANANRSENMNVVFFIRLTKFIPALICIVHFRAMRSFKELKMVIEAVWDATREGDADLTDKLPVGLMEVDGVNERETEGTSLRLEVLVPVREVASVRDLDKYAVVLCDG